MEVARAPEGFLMPHHMYRGRRPAAATGGGPGPRRTRIMRTAPHEFYGGVMVATPSVDLDVDDGGSAPTYFTARLSTSGGFRSQRRGGPAGDDGDHGRRRRGDLLCDVPGGVRGRRRAEDDAVRARVPRGVHRGVALGQPLLPALPLQAAHPGGGGRRRPTPTAGKPAGIDDDGRVVSCQWHNAMLVRI